MVTKREQEWQYIYQTKQTLKSKTVTKDKKRSIHNDNRLVQLEDVTIKMYQTTKHLSIYNNIDGYEREIAIQ